MTWEEINKELFEEEDTKRFTYDSKTVSILKDGEFWLDGNIDTACNHSEICNELNALNDENEQLKFELEECREHKLFSRRQLEEENEQLKKENERLKKRKPVENIYKVF